MVACILCIFKSALRTLGTVKISIVSCSIEIIFMVKSDNHMKFYGGFLGLSNNNIMAIASSPLFLPLLADSDE
jgi:hypothetical protein